MTPTQEKRLRSLGIVTDAAYSAAQLDLKSRIRARQDIDRKLADLDASRARAVGGEITDPALRVGADLLWQRWADDQRRVLNRQLAQARAAENEARRKAAHAFGRHQALLKTLEKRR